MEAAETLINMDTVIMWNLEILLESGQKTAGNCLTAFVLLKHWATNGAKTLRKDTQLSSLIESCIEQRLQVWPNKKIKEKKNRIAFVKNLFD